MRKMIEVITTFEDRTEADRVGLKLVEERLAACAQIAGPVTSHYQWQGKLESSEEWVCTLKTRDDLFERVDSRLRQLHSYDEPQVVAVVIERMSAGYRAWLEQQLDGDEDQ